MASSSQQQFLSMPDALSTRDAWLDPFDWYREMRATAPVRYDPDRQVWDVFRYDEAKHVLADPETFSSDITSASAFEFPADEASLPLRNSILRSDPPRHTWLRDIVEGQFRPGVVQGLAPHIRDIATELLDDVGDDGRMDVIADLAYPLPVIVIAELLGVPTDDRERFKQWSDTLVADVGAAGDPQTVMERQQETIRELRSYFEDLVAQRRAQPADDLITHLVTADPDGHTLTDEDVLGYCILLLVAGNITTTNLIGNALWCFDEQSGLVDRLAADRDLLALALEEVLRYRSPVQALTRVATSDVTVGDHTVEAGDLLVVWLGSANRDERQFDDPDAFDPERSPNQHLAFGHGVHFCLGAPLARLEARVTLGQLLDRFDEVERVDQRLEPVSSSFLYGVEQLPVRFDVDG